ncbi:DUF1127 domain-containing protein [Pseudocitrobacter cyperus]|uniref:DUF1127 domain-containing protein n=1 Tax=Pseudocitrobacter cyperus TaxID=3112843 RepID=A0ABV0HP48_9ENTR
MGFYENRAKRPFIGWVLLYRAVQQWYLRKRTQRILDKMSDEQLKDIGLTRNDYR